MNVVLCGPRTKRPGTLSHLILFGASLFLPFVLLGQGYFGTVSGEVDGTERGGRRRRQR